MNNLKISKIIWILLFVVFSTQGIMADSYSKYVGQSVILPIPKCPVPNGTVDSWSYATTNSNINIINGGKFTPSSATIIRYFEGGATIECKFSYHYLLNNREFYNTSVEYHTIRALSNDISITGNTTSLAVGEGSQLSYRFSHSTFDAIPEVTWKSRSNNATVSASGYVTARSSGTAEITATSNLGNNTASYLIYIEDNNVRPTSVSIEDMVSLYVGEKYKLTARVYPSGAETGLLWRSSNSSVASVSSSGNITGNMKGTAVITVTTTEGNCSAQCQVTVKEKPGDGTGDITEPTAPTSISIPKELTIKVGNEITIQPTFLPEGTSAKVSWVSSDKTVAQISSTGKLVAKKEGKCTILVKTIDGKLSAKCKVVVTGNASGDKLESLKLPQTAVIAVGEELQLKPIVQPSNHSSSLKWSCDDIDVASVSSIGLVKGKKPGNAKITVTSDNGLSASCIVTVKKENEDINLDILDDKIDTINKIIEKSFKAL